jgi:hypothetical protein
MRSIPQQCPHCNASMGRLVQKGNVIYLDTGEWLVLDARKHCHNCGKVFVFKRPRASFDELMARAEKQEGGLFVS